MSLFMQLLEDDDDDPDKRLRDVTGQNARDQWIQLALCSFLAVSAFLTFCVLRPRWTGLYSARKRTKHSAAVLPELPDSLFGWILPLWRVTEQQVLASAGLDAYVFLAFFKMAMKILSITIFFSLVVLKPVHDANPGTDGGNDDGGHKSPDFYLAGNSTGNHTDGDHKLHLPWKDNGASYLWMYVFFAYLFTAITVYFVVSETKRVIEVRQEYLGTQTTVTDRTIRLEGIPKELQDEAKIKEFVDDLGIGTVESVTLCCKWGELDRTMTERMDTLRRLEEAYTIYQRRRAVERNLATLPSVQPPSTGPLSHGADDDAEGISEDGTPLNGNAGPTSNVPYRHSRPTITLRFGRFNLRTKKVDAIDHYEEKLRTLDEKVKMLRKSDFATTSLAFVTMDSVAAAQVAIQAVLDSSPLQFLAYSSPPPSDVLWQNTYLSRTNRLTKSWAITILIVLSTIFWSATYIPIATLLSIPTIGKVSPSAADFLKEHKNVASFVTTQLPTLLISLINVLAPYLYYYLSWRQGMISQGDIELSAISKNFFFLFVNFFLFFTALGSGVQFYQFVLRFGDALDKTFQTIAHTLAEALRSQLIFYTDFILLQGLGLFPFRLLEAGSVSLYPVYRMGAKTPRDYAELVQPPVFSYGFYLPSALLIFIICLTYSVLRESWTILLAGFVYFALGHFVYKYQLLYAMDHQQQSLGKSWGMMCDRVFIGLLVFQVTTAGELVGKGAIARSVLVVPLIALTIWISIMYSRTYKPLMKFIALRSVRRGEPYQDDPAIFSPDTQSIMSNSDILTRNVWADTRVHTETRRRYGHPTTDEDEVLEKKFINPSLVAPLRGVWIADKTLREPNGGLSAVPEEPTEETRYRDDDDDDDDNNSEVDNTV